MVLYDSIVITLSISPRRQVRLCFSSVWETRHMQWPWGVKVIMVDDKGHKCIKGEAETRRAKTFVFRNDALQPKT